MILLLFWREDAVMSFLSSLGPTVVRSAEQPHDVLAFVSRAQLTDRQVQLRHTKGYSVKRQSVQCTKERLFQKKKKVDKRNKIRWMSTFSNFTHNESWAAVLTSASAISLTGAGTREGRLSSCVTTTTRHQRWGSLSALSPKTLFAITHYHLTRDAS